MKATYIHHTYVYVINLNQYFYTIVKKTFAKMKHNYLYFQNTVITAPTKYIFRHSNFNNIFKYLIMQ